MVLIALPPSYPLVSALVPAALVPQVEQLMAFPEVAAALAPPPRQLVEVLATTVLPV